MEAKELTKGLLVTLDEKVYRVNSWGTKHWGYIPILKTYVMLGRATDVEVIVWGEFVEKLAKV